MRVLVVGGGGREHAIAWALSRAGSTEIIAAPGNPGIGSVGRLFDTAVTDTEAMTSLAVEQSVDLVVVGPEAPLVAGLADRVRAEGIACLGPGSAEAALEGSKWFAKTIMDEAGVPSAEGRLLDDPDQAMAILGDAPGDWVIKADGLAAGKGVFLPETRDEARAALEKLASGGLGPSGERFVLERRLRGREASVLAICSGTSAVVLPAGRDHKRAGEGDTGPNTGGMGAICPPEDLPEDFSERVRQRVILPVLRSLSERGMDYRGVLYAGLMVGGDGEPMVLEFNVRFGDPESQAVLPLTRPDSLLEACVAAAEGGDLSGMRIETERDLSAACVVAASGGYPGSYERGYPVTGLDDVGDALVFHAGTSTDEHGRIVTSGGRVLGVVGTGPAMEEAVERAYSALSSIGFRGMYFRRDIGRSV